MQIWRERYSIYSTLFWGKLVVLQSVYPTLVDMSSLMGGGWEEAVSDGYFDTQINLKRKM